MHKLTLHKLQSCLPMCLRDIQNSPSELRSFVNSSLIKVDQPVTKAEEQAYRDPAESPGLSKLCAHHDGWSCPGRAPVGTRYHPGARCQLCPTLTLVLHGNSKWTFWRCVQVEELLRLVTEHGLIYMTPSLLNGEGGAHPTQRVC